MYYNILIIGNYFRAYEAIFRHRKLLQMETSFKYETTSVVITTGEHTYRDINIYIYTHGYIGIEI